jgi:hypothetical protein
MAPVFRENPEKMLFHCLTYNECIFTLVHLFFIYYFLYFFHCNSGNCRLI